MTLKIILLSLSLIIFSIIVYLVYAYKNRKVGFAKPLYFGAMGCYKLIAGLDNEEVQVNGYKSHYLDNKRMDKSVMVLIHGYPQCKESWIRFAKKYTSKYRVIIPDLYGFGKNYESTPVADKNFEFGEEDDGYRYSLQNLAEFVHDFIEALGLSKFHIVGISMGGGIACAFAMKYSSKLESLIAIDPAGFNGNGEKSALGKYMDQWSDYESKKKNLIIAPIDISIERISLLRTYLFNKEHSLDTLLFLFAFYFKHYVVDRHNFCERVINHFTNWEDGSYKEPLDDGLKNITCPILLIWGKNDKIIDFSRYEYLVKQMKQLNHPCFVHKPIENCGHVPIIDKASETEAIMNDFLKDLRKLLG